MSLPARPAGRSRVPLPVSVWVPLAVGTVLLFILVSGLMVRAHWQREAGQVQALQQGALLARSLDDHANRVFDAVAVVLESLSVQLGDAAPMDEREITAEMSHSIRAVPALRSVAVLDASGRVRASTLPRDVEVQVDLHRLLPEVPRLPAGDPVIGTPVQGRTLREIAAGGQGPARFIPVALATRGPDPRVLLALVDANAFTQHQVLLLGPSQRRALLMSTAGELLAHSVAQAPDMPTLRAALQALRSPEGTREQVSFIGPSAGGPDEIVTSLMSQRWPLVTVVEESRSDAQALPREVLRQSAVGALFGSSIIAALTWVLHRGLRSRDRAARTIAEAQRLLAERERDLAVLVRSVQELLFRTDLEGRITFVNARWAEVMDCKPLRALGRPLQEFIADRDALAVASLFERRNAVGARHACLALPSTIGAARSLDVTVVPLIEGEVMVGFAGSATDVTERIRAQRQLQRQLDLNEQLIQISPLPVCMIDERGRYLTVNRAWEEFNGRRREDVEGQPVGFFLPPQERAQHEAHDRSLLSGGEPVSYEARVLRADGSTRDVVLKKVVVRTEGGRVSGVLEVLMDVTEFRTAERTIREARDAAEEASRAKSEFIANISHELRTPLQSIIGFSELGRAGRGSSQTHHSMFREIHDSGGRMLALVNDLLDVSRLQSAVGTFHLERTDLRLLLRAVAQEFQPLLQSEQKQLHLHLPQQALLARVDPLRFQQVVRNVVANAVKFSPPGHSVKLHGGLRLDGQIEVRVRDHGPGIPPQELDSIFEPFVQSSRTRSGAGGTGLGLAISRQIMTLLQGHITAANAEGGGAIVTLWLPQAAVTESAGEATSASA